MTRRQWRRTLLLVRLALIGLIALAVLAPPPPPVEPGVTEVDLRSGRTERVLLIGDSTLWRAEPILNERQPHWHVDAKRGRPVKALGPRLDAYLRHNPAPDMFVMALGANRSHNPDWSKRRLVHALNKLPRRTDVLLLLVVRTGKFQAWKDRVLRDYNRFSRQVARQRPNTWVVNWRRAVLRDPTLNHRTGRSSLLEDGVHQTGGPRARIRQGPGARRFAGMIERKARQVAR